MAGSAQQPKRHPGRASSPRLRILRRGSDHLPAKSAGVVAHSRLDPHSLGCRALRHASGVQLLGGDCIVRSLPE
jgi:hypothetical protein